MAGEISNTDANSLRPVIGTQANSQMHWRFVTNATATPGQSKLEKNSPLAAAYKLNAKDPAKSNTPQIPLSRLFFKHCQIPPQLRFFTSDTSARRPLLKTRVICHRAAICRQTITTLAMLPHPARFGSAEAPFAFINSAEVLDRVDFEAGRNRFAAHLATEVVPGFGDHRFTYRAHAGFKLINLYRWRIKPATTAKSQRVQASGRLISCAMMVAVNNALSSAVSAFTLINGEKTASIIKAWRTWRCKVILVFPSKRRGGESPVGARNMQRRRSLQAPHQPHNLKKSQRFFITICPGPFWRRTSSCW